VFASALTTTHVSTEGFLNTGDFFLPTDDRASFGHSVLLESFQYDHNIVVLSNPSSSEDLIVRADVVDYEIVFRNISFNVPNSMAVGVTCEIELLAVSCSPEEGQLAVGLHLTHHIVGCMCALVQCIVEMRD